MADENKDLAGKVPEGLFSSESSQAHPQARPTEPRASTIAGLSFPPDPRGPPPGAAEVVLSDVEATQDSSPRNVSSSTPPPLGQSEGHDAWTVEHMHRQSTVPPVRHDDVDRLRELSAQPERLPSPLPPQSGGGALDLVDRSRPSQQLDLMGEMEDRYALDDLTGALRYAELILGSDPANEQAKRCATNCRERLVRLYSSKIGDLDCVLKSALGDNELRWLGLDHRSGFLLSRVDGLSTVEEILDVCGMPRLEALKSLVELLERGAIRLVG